MSFCNVSTMMALQKLPNKGFFVECNSPYAEFTPEHPMNTLKRRYYPRAQGAFFQTEENRDFYDYLDIQKWVIPNPLQGDFPDRHEGRRRKVIVSFARLAKAKNFPLMLESFALLAADFPDYSLEIYGEGPLKKSLQAQTKELGLDSRVVFHPFDTALHQKIKDCALYVSSSDREGMSNSMLEALAIGLPCVCTDCAGGGARAIIKPYENGLLVPMRDKQALAAAMREIIENPNLAETLSKNAIKIRQDLALDKIISLWWQALWPEQEAQTSKLP